MAYVVKSLTAFAPVPSAYRLGPCEWLHTCTARSILFDRFVLPSPPLWCPVRHRLRIHQPAVNYLATFQLTALAQPCDVTLCDAKLLSSLICSEPVFQGNVFSFRHISAIRDYTPIWSGVNRPCIVQLSKVRIVMAAKWPLPRPPGAAPPLVGSQHLKRICAYIVKESIQQTDITSPRRSKYIAARVLVQDDFPLWQ
jgi:hypothetical protein